MAEVTPDADNLLHVRGLYKSHQDAGGVKQVLRNITLSVKPGEFVSIGGPSGSGKSTLLNILGGIDIADSGSVEIHGSDLTLLTEHQRTEFRKRSIGLVFQFFNLVPTLTVEENLLLPLELVGDQEGLAKVNYWLQRLNLIDRSNAYPSQLSGGEQQRIAVIRAVIHRPKLLLADEPTGNLDRRAGLLVLQLLREVVQNGTGIVMVTHSEEAAAAADRRLCLIDGVISDDES